ncbi:LOW QUALITY PROTEIN: protein arginine N-methyltransferase 8 [Drosophila eugracilis]|uniref:LOW QUALITY PROTEIN: protein arginine N-methyltransferase 8 n=1 Tax=Drosophila eugracilis TaxID=29029 RepID=UPI0007E8029A|nr:LOW QUALITY PROTEIN: protein arginine N-methyltransferase 8 [Drosophila eugracilis]
MLGTGEGYASADRNLDLALKRNKDRREQESVYFSLYGRIEVHEWLLKDTVRMKAYREAILLNEFFKHKTVLDVGCGMGVLSMFAAKAGSKKVFAVDAATITDLAHRIVQDNGYGSVISVIHGKVEDIELPSDIDKVDIIVCDWMGHCLFAENMLDSLIFARDKWLSAGGHIFPDTAQLYLAAIKGLDQDLGFWHDVHGFDLSAIRRKCESKAVVEHVTAGQVMSKVCLVKSLDLYTACRQSANFRFFYELKVTRNGWVHALVAYFDVGFSKSPHRISFSTSPSAPWTHWNQTVFYLETPLPVKSGEVIKGVFAMKPSEHSIFDLEFDIYLDFEGREKYVTIQQSFVLSNSFTLCGL